MEIKRITAQKPITLEEFFGEMVALGPGNGYSRIASRMLELLVLLPNIEGPPVWAVTSHADLHLLDKDDYQSRTLASIRCGEFHFEIEYPMPSSEAPWPGACVRAQTNDPMRACEMVAFGLSKATSFPYRVSAMNAEPSN